MNAPAMLSAALEVALNRYLGLEASALEACAQLSGRRIALHAQAPDWRFVIEFHAGGVRVGGELDGAADVSVSGRMPALMRLAWTVAQGQSGMPQDLQVEGDVELLQRFNRVLAGVGFDPEEFAARFVGDAAAHRATQGLRSLFDWGRRAASTLGLDAAEYLREETRDLARAADVEDWMNEIDRLRDDVERFDARLRRLETPPPRLDETPNS
ncbi:sterol-binding protein [Sinimarinibacterium sp. CAU 1509]|uniref:ubiquinone biosynthesis accessory factor UbiJ n=1 Tax=Sinimarinibacterium sp. CAU 1509 TaxID=2562283 RepID=UPI0010AB6FBE|nr:SCP2 sterol-binding domain-containing protein [Sinimarinibacterium sp. CAU 1509]TJY64811.1 sterol-binding protein [Sinimarinibacterium sp. CAU 1509]